MGDFNVSCGISGLTINEGDEVGFVMLEPKSPEPYQTIKLKEPRNLTVYSTEFYLPAFPPVYATYDNYGRMTGLESNITTSVLETIFGRPALDVINAAGNHSRSVYYDDSPIYKLYYPETNKKQKQYGLSEEEALVSHGFIEGNAADGSALYSFNNYSLQKIDNAWHLTIKKDSRVYTRQITTRSYGSDAIIDAFSDVTGVFPGYDPGDYESVSKLKNMSGMFFLKEAFIPFLTNVEKWQSFGFHEDRLRKDWDEFNRMIKEHQPVEGEKTFYGIPENLHLQVSLSAFVSDGMKECLKFDPQHLYLLPKFYGTEEIFAATRLVQLMQSVNRILEPSVSGEQYGNHEASVILHNIVGEILDKRTKQYNNDFYA